MATYIRGLLGEVAKDESAAVRLQFPIEVGTDEAQTLTIQKPSESETGFASPDDTGACTQVDGTVYSVDLEAADVDEEGILFVKSAGTTDTQVGWIKVLGEDALKAADLPTNFGSMDIDTSGRVLTKTDAQKRLERSR